MSLLNVGKETPLTGFESGRKIVVAHLKSLGDEKKATTIQVEALVASL